MTVSRKASPGGVKTKVIEMEDGYWWALKRGDPDARLQPVKVDDEMWIEVIGEYQRSMVDDWELVERIAAPEKVQMHMFDEELRRKAAEMKDDFNARYSLWLEWIARNQDVLDVGRGFVYRIGFDSFRIEKAFGRMQPHYQLMASGDHAIRDTGGKLIPFAEWDVGLIDIWEKMFPKMMPVMERVLRDRWFRRDGIWDGSEARYHTDFKIFQGIGGK